jgi:hypothetical protein
MKACSYPFFAAGTLTLAASLFAVPVAATGQQTPKVPDSVVAMAKKYDETRQKTLGPLLESFAADLKARMVPALTRQGKADAAIKIGEAANALKNAPVPVLPSSGAPFPAELFALVQASPEWGLFSVKFTQAESALNESYKKALEREKTVFQNKGDPYAMVAVDNEAKRVDVLRGGATAVSPASPSAAKAVASSPENTKPSAEPKKISAADKRRIESWIVGKTWSVEGEDELIYFAKGGKGARSLKGAVTTALEWQVDDFGKVSVSRAGWGKKVTFTSATEGTMVFSDPSRPQTVFKVLLSNEVIEGTK